jgi:hypothetical protein
MKKQIFFCKIETWWNDVKVGEVLGSDVTDGISGSFDPFEDELRPKL